MSDRRRQDVLYYGKQVNPPRQVSEDFSKYGAIQSSNKNSKYIYKKTETTHCCVIL